MSSLPNEQQDPRNPRVNVSAPAAVVANGRKGTIYSFVRDDDEDRFTQNVTNVMAQGWTPQGGLSVDSNGTLYQALIKHDQPYTGGKRRAVKKNKTRKHKKPHA